MGIKTPWTLKDKENWKETHRISGHIWVVFGLVLCVNAFVGSELLIIISLGSIVGIPFVASWRYSRKSA